MKLKYALIFGLLLTIILLPGTNLRATDKHAQVEKNFTEYTQQDVEDQINALISKSNKSGNDYAQLGFLLAIYKNDFDKALNNFNVALKMEDNEQALFGKIFIEDEVYNDQPNVQKDVLQFIQLFPSSYYTSYFAEKYFKNSNYMYFNKKNKEIADVLNNLLQNEKLTGYNRILFSSELTDLYNSEYKYDLSSNLFFANYPLTKWYTLGVIGDKDENDSMLDIFSPEVKIKLNEEFKSNYDIIKWEKTNIEYPSLSSINKNIKNNYNGSATFYLTYINSPEDMDVFFYNMTKYDKSKIWLNNALILYKDYRFEKNYPNNIIPVKLNKGWNKLLLKCEKQGLSSSNEFLILDSELNPIQNISSSNEFSAKELPKTPELLPNEVIHHNYHNPLPGEYFALKYNSGIISFPDYFCYLYFRYDNDLIEETYYKVKALHEKNKESILINLLYAKAVNNATRFIGEDKANNIMKGVHEKILTINKNILPSILYLSEYYLSKDPQKSKEYIDDALKVAPLSWAVNKKLISLYSNQYWQAEVFRVVKKMSEIYPFADEILEKLISYYYEHDNFAKAYELELFLDKEIKDCSFSFPKFYKMQDENKYKEALQYLDGFVQKYPYLKDYYNNVFLKLYKYLKMHDEYTKLIYDIIEKHPLQKYSELKELADYYLSINKNKDAIAIYKEINETAAYKRKFNKDVNDFLNYMLNVPDDPIFEDNVDVNDLIENAPATEEHPEISKITLYKRVVNKLVGKDCNMSIQHVHEVVKILNKKGGEEFRSYSPGDYLIEAHVYTPDGKVLEPDPAQEYYSMRLPSLDKDSVVELIYENYNILESSGEKSLHKDTFASNVFRYSDNYVCKYEYVFAYPENATWIKNEIKNMEKKKTKIETKDGYKIYTWNFNNIEDYKYESFMPDPSKLFPYVRMYREGEYRFGFDNKSDVLDSTIIPINTIATDLKANELLDGIDNQMDQILAIYKFVVTEIKEGYQDNPSQILLKKEGDLSNLFMALMRSAGIEAYYALAGRIPDDTSEYSDDYSPYFYSKLIYLPKNKYHDEMLFSIARYLPFNTINPTAQGGMALVNKNNVLFYLEVPKKNMKSPEMNFNAEVKIDENGNCEFKLNLEINEYYVAALLNQLEQATNEEQKKLLIQQLASQFITGANVSKFTLPEFDVNGGNNLIVISGTAANFAEKRGNKLRFQPVFPKLSFSRQFLHETTRKFPLDLKMLKEQANQYFEYKYILPENSEVRNYENKLISKKYGIYSLSQSLNGNVLHAIRTMKMFPFEIPPEEYPKFIKFCKNLDKIEKKWVIVRLH